MASSDASWIEGLLARFEARRGDLSVFVKELKQRFTQWYNRRKHRRGTLWEDRFKSVLVEGSENALSIMAAYIDLNPVRAGMVDDPKDYRWCGYAEAVAGGRQAREGLALMLGHTHFGKNRVLVWENTAPRYRLLLYGQGEACEANEGHGTKSRRGFSREQVETEGARGGKLPLRDILRCRVRYFCDGAILGSVGFVNGVFESQRWRFGPKRKSGARRMQGADWGELRVLRDLRVSVLG